MTDIELKALALLNEVRSEYPFAADYHAIGIALNRAIEQHEAFKQKVSDAAKVYDEVGAPMGWEGFDQFIIPKPDPLVDVLADTFGASLIDADELRAALEARGLEIREKGQ